MNEQSPYRLIIHRPDAQETFLLPIGITKLGRDSIRDLVLMHPMVSRLHSQIICTATSCEITDLESANGTTVNDQVLSPHTAYSLKPNDRIHIGPFELVVEIVQQKVEIALEMEANEVNAELADINAPLSTEDISIKPFSGPLVTPSSNGHPPIHPPGDIPPALPPIHDEIASSNEPTIMVEGASIYSTRLINYLPDIYRNSSADRFMERFLGLFESIWLPIEYTINNFDLYLDPRTAPVEFLPWLAQWFDVWIDFSLKEEQVRSFLKEAPQIYASRGTRGAMIRILEIFTGDTPEIIEFAENQAPHTFKVRYAHRNSAVNQSLIERLIDANKPAHTTYNLEFGR